MNLNIYELVETYIAEELIEMIDDNDHILTIVNDHAICKVDGGNTTFQKTENGFESFSAGPNWRDQQSEIRSREFLIERFTTALETIKKDYEKFGFDTDDEFVSYITISEKQEDYENF